jgi:hypothetical protein
MLDIAELQSDPLLNLTLGPALLVQVLLFLNLLSFVFGHDSRYDDVLWPLFLALKVDLRLVFRWIDLRWATILFLQLELQFILQMFDQFDLILLELLLIRQPLGATGTYLGTIHNLRQTQATPH